MQFRRPSKIEVGINIAPLVDVVFLLVIFFAVSTTFLENAGLKLELPSSSSTAIQEPKDVTVLLAEDGTISFEGKVVSAERLSVRLRELLPQAERRMVVLRADSATSHGDVVAMMDLIREAGAEGLTVAARANTD